MKNKFVYLVVLVAILFTVCNTAICGTRTAVSPKYKTLIVNGQNNHNWKIGSASMKQILEGSGLFTVDMATAYSDKENKRLGRNEPALMTIKYGKGRVFHTIIGHASEKNQAMKCAGFIVTSLRGAEWAASGKVTQAVPKNLLSKTEVRLLEDYKIDRQ